MAPSKKLSAARINLPNPYETKTFTIRQLVRRWRKWDYDEDDIEYLIKEGHLKQAFDTVRLDANLDKSYYDLRDIHFYKHYVGDGVLLKIKASTLEKLVGSVAKDNLIPCSEIDFLYLPKEESARKIGTGKEDYIRFFYDVDGNQLIPTHSYNFLDPEGGEHLIPVSVDKHLFDELLIIPLEEVERFEKENFPERKGKGERPDTTKLKDDIMEIIKDLGYNPKSFPEWGKPRPPELLKILRSVSKIVRKRTAKTEVWEEYILRLCEKDKHKDNRPLSKAFLDFRDINENRFKRAWEDLMAAKKITNKKPKKD